ncbi:MAG: diguanylate cyclase domain-containing protein, partial [bacterium]
DFIGLVVAPLIVFTVAAFFSYKVYQRADFLETHKLKQQVHLDAGQLERKVKAAVTDCTRGLMRMRSRMLRAGTNSKELWWNDAQLFLRDHSYLQSVVYLPNNGETMEVLDLVDPLASYAQKLQKLVETETAKGLVDLPIRAAPPFRISESEVGLVFYLLLNQEDPAAGFIGVVFRVRTTLEMFIADLDAQDYTLTLSDQGKPLMVLGQTGKTSNFSSSFTMDVDGDGSFWTFSLVIPDLMVKLIRGSAPEKLLMTGLSASFLLGVAIFLIFKLYLQKKLLIGTNQALNQEAKIRKQAEERMRYMATHDHLTGLPNRAVFYDTLQEIWSELDFSTKYLVVIYFDLDKFKEVNDLHGHGVGDELLARLPEQLGSQLSAAHLLARVGGDEFVILGQFDKDIEQIEQFVENILLTLSGKLEVSGVELQCTVSAGVAISDETIDKPETIVMHADKALLRAKSDGRNRYYFYSNFADEVPGERKKE